MSAASAHPPTTPSLFPDLPDPAEPQSDDSTGPVSPPEPPNPAAVETIPANSESPIESKPPKKVKQAKKAIKPGKPTPAQRAYLERGLNQPGGKLPLFDAVGRRVDGRVVQTCLDKGWAEPWFANALKPDWLVCRLTDKGRAALQIQTGPAPTPNHSEHS